MSKSAILHKSKTPSVEWGTIVITTKQFRIFWKPEWYIPFTRKILLLHTQSLRHRLCIQLKQRISHQSHLKRRQDYGNQVVSVMLSCNGIILNYAVILYDRSKSKIQIVQEIAQELPVAPVVSYFLCDSWYTSVKVMDSFIQKGFYTIGALKTNRIIYPFEIRQKVSDFALHLRKIFRDS